MYESSLFFAALRDILVFAGVRDFTYNAIVTRALRSPWLALTRRLSL
jgi:hypothetical protein